MDRRRFVAGMAGVFAAPLARAQAQRVRRIGLLAPSNAQIPYFDALRKELAILGHVEGRNIAFELRNADAKLERLPSLVDELLNLKVELIVVSANPAVLAAQRATKLVPIVMGTVADPVGSGFVASLARPGGNITGVSNAFEEVVAKNLELLIEIVPKLARIAVIRNPNNATHRQVSEIVNGAARRVGVTLQFLDAPTLEALDQAFAAAGRERAGGVMVLADPFMNSQRDRLAQLALRHRLPSALPAQEYVAAGGLMSYGPNYADNFRRAASQADKILRGASPADIPVELSNRFELTINSATAKTLGLTIPQLILLRADRVIE